MIITDLENVSKITGVGINKDYELVIMCPHCNVGLLQYRPSGHNYSTLHFDISYMIKPDRLICPKCNWSRDVEDVVYSEEHGWAILLRGKS
jgi:hypothetical protein